MRRLAALGCVMVLAVSGCGRLGDALSAKNHRQVAESEIPGMWSSDCGTTLALQADGTAAISGIGEYVNGRLTGRESGEGQWYYEDPDTDDQRITLSLPIETTGAFPYLTTELEVNGDEKELTAIEYLSKAGSRSPVCNYRKTG